MEFRGKEVRTNQWRYGQYYTDGDNSYILSSNAEYNLIEDKHMLTVECSIVESHTVGQYVPCLKAYYGDIIRSFEHDEGGIASISEALVRYSEDLCRVIVDDGETFLDADEVGICKIVGNIYDNPKLLDNLKLPLDINQSSSNIIINQI